MSVAFDPAYTALATSLLKEGSEGIAIPESVDVVEFELFGFVELELPCRPYKVEEFTDQVGAPGTGLYQFVALPFGIVEIGYLFKKLILDAELVGTTVGKLLTEGY